MVRNDLYTFKFFSQKKYELYTIMKFVEHKQELSKFCHLPDFNVSHTATHVKTIVNLIPNTGQHLHVI